jgi:tetratricopeptide (TPR) repeat protein
MKIAQFNAVVSIALFNLLSISLPITPHSLLVAPAAAQVNHSTPPPQINRWRIPDHLLPYVSPLTDAHSSPLPSQSEAQIVRQRLVEANRLIEQGAQQYDKSQFQEAFQSLQQALAISRDTQVRAEQPSISEWIEANTLVNLGAVFNELEAPQQAIDYLQQALPIFQEQGDRNSEATTLLNLSGAYHQLEQYQELIEYAEQARLIYQEVNDRRGEGLALVNLGVAYSALGQYSKSSEYYKQALPILQDVGDRKGEAKTLMNLGSVYEKLSGYDRSLYYYRQALPIVRELGARNTEGNLLANIGRLYINHESPQSAIQFLQQSVEVRESLREQIQQLPQTVRQAYVDSIAPDYQLLADLLKQQNRQTEAQQVLDLLR